MPNHDLWALNESLSKGSFYVAETNYDRKKPPPSFDDRRYPMENCIEDVSTYDGSLARSPAPAPALEWCPLGSSVDGLIGWIVVIDWIHSFIH